MLYKYCSSELKQLIIFNKWNLIVKCYQIILTDASFDLKNVSLHVEININYD